MKIVLERSSLLKSLVRIARVVEKKTTVPILANVLLVAAAETLVLKATDLDLEIGDDVPAEVLQSGSTSVPAQLLLDIVRKSPDGSQIKLELNADGGQLTVSVGRSRFKLQALPATDFPEIEHKGFSHAFTLPARDMLRLFERTSFAMSTEETRYYLNGVFLHVPESYKHAVGLVPLPLLRAVATDGHRLARTEIAAPSGSEGMPGIIVPRKTVAELLKLLDTDAETKVEISDAKLRVSVGAAVLTSKLIDGTFPDYQRVIPTGNDKALTLDRQIFLSAVDRVCSISTERGRGIALSLSEGAMVLKARAPDAGEALDEIDVGYSSDEMEIGFNGRYLSDLSGQLAGAEMRFMLSDPGSPSLVTDPADEASLYVLMPMRV